MDHASADHLVFKNNPVYLKSYLDKYVEVKTVDGSILQGKIYTIDPVSESVVLVSNNPDTVSLSTDIIMGHSLKSIDIIPLPNDKFEDFSVDIFDIGWKDKYSKDVIIKRRKAVKDWLCQNRLPVEETDDMLRLNTTLEICPPYDSNSCLSLDGNDTILGRVQDLITSIPSYLLDIET